jgi:hypothetical protein
MQGRFRVASVAVVASVGLLLTAGCTSTPASPTRAEAAVDTAESTPPPQATIAFTPASNTSDVAPGEPVTVTAANGKLTGVTVTDDKGKTLAGQTSADGLTWTSDQGVKISRKYRLQATAVDSDGRVTESSGFFATVTPRKVLETYISPLDGQSVGVGMPVIVRFTAPVKDRAAVEAALSVDSKKPIVGAWSWVSDEEVHFRPREYWPAYNTVTVHVDLKGVDAGRGVWGMENRTVKFRTGSSMISVVEYAARLPGDLTAEHTRAAEAASGDSALTGDSARAARFGWCTGLAGLVLGGTRQWTPALVDRRPLRDLSLCHGELGIAEAVAMTATPDSDPLRRRYAGLVLDALDRHGPRCGTPGGVPTPGLLTGLAGIGYGMLRLGFGDEVPSALLLEPRERER